MTRLLFIAASLLGAATIAWIAASFIGGSNFALAVTAIIAATYLLGLVELQQFRRATIGLGSTLRALPEGKAGAGSEELAWLSRIDPSLHNSVRQRIDGDAIPLPGLIFTPYLASLLVMLGLLGTFIGMVDTLQGAVTALQGDTELEAIRNGLAAPIQGLGVAFGTSVAGIAASAMLGLGSTLCRRERLMVSRQLDRVCASRFNEYSHHYKREQAYGAMQAQALPDITQRLAQLADNVQTMGQTLSDTLIDNQVKLHSSVESAFKGLTESVDQSLHSSLAENGRIASVSLAENGRIASASLEPLIAQTLEGIQAHASGVQAVLAESSKTQLAQINAHLSDILEQVTARLDAADQVRQAGLVEALTATQQATATQITGLAQELAAPVAALTDSAVEGPRAAAELIEELRSQVSINLSRETQQLEQQQTLLLQLSELTSGLGETSTEQRAALHSAAENLVVGSIEMNSLGEAFGVAVKIQSESNQSLMDTLSRVEDALGEVSNRSDEQMTFYIDQAREVIDQTLLSQQGFMEELRQLAPDALTAEAS
jgi:hypothetical protein